MLCNATRASKLSLQLICCRSSASYTRSASGLEGFRKTAERPICDGVKSRDNRRHDGFVPSPHKDHSPHFLSASRQNCSGQLLLILSTKSFQHFLLTYCSITCAALSLSWLIIQLFGLLSRRRDACLGDFHHVQAFLRCSQAIIG